MRETLAARSLAVPARVRTFVRHCLRQLEDESTASDAALGEITLLPHQVAGAARLRAILQRHGGALLADEVGLGKTYTALAVARESARILVVAPASVREMWRDASARCAVPVTVVSYEQLSAGRLPPAARWELVILDEAHRARSPATRRYQAIAQLAVGARLLLLSATPVHNRRGDLDALMALFLGGGAASLDAATLGALIVRRRVDDVGTHLPALGAVQRHALPRAPAVLDAMRALPPPLPPSDGGVATALVALQLARAWCSSDAALLAAIRRRLATATAIEHALDAGRLPTHRDLAAWTPQGDGSVQLAFPELVAAAPCGDIASQHAVVRRHADALRALRTLVRTHAARDHVRVDTLRRILDAHRDRQVVIFTHSAETAESVFRALRDHARVALLTGRGACIASGAIPRAELLAAFAPDGDRRRRTDDIARVDVLVASDVVSEGVNLHAASVIVHLDLPWTVARFEQRMGRVRRIGSAHGAIASHLILPPADAEELGSAVRVLARKAQLAAGTVGASTILLGAEAWAPLASGSDDHAPVAARHALIAKLRAIDRAAVGRASWVTNDDTPIAVPGLDAPRTLALVRVAHDARLLVASPAGASDAPHDVGAVLEHLAAAWAPHASAASECKSSRNRPPASETERAIEPAIERATDRSIDRSIDRSTDRAILGWCATEAARRQLRGDIAHDSLAHRRLLRALATAVARAPRTRRSQVAARAATARALAWRHTGAGADRILDELSASAPFAASLGAIARNSPHLPAAVVQPPGRGGRATAPAIVATPAAIAHDEAWLEHVLRRLSETPTRPPLLPLGIPPLVAGRDTETPRDDAAATVTVVATLTLIPDRSAP
ncbi:MAG: DEAD/DEAH box helicase [Gemmatimonadaceae bacterium]|nr:DEAD/DEAH box helicase [Gemmatimonadaceae bacterium]